MASIIKVDRILDSTELGKVDIPGGIETDVLNATELVADTWKSQDGTENYKCKCWVNFDGTTTPPTIRASGNVSSVVRNSTGDYTVNFETDLEDVNYSVSGSAGFVGTVTNNQVFLWQKDVGNRSPSQCRVVVTQHGQAGGWIPEPKDSDIVDVCFFR